MLLIFFDAENMVLREIFLFSLFCFSGSACFANEPVCARHAGEAGAAGIAYYPSVEAKITESEKTGFYSAPNAECIIKGMFIDKDSYLTV